MNAINTLSQLVTHGFSGAKCSLDEAEKPTVSSFLNVHLDDYSMVVEQRPDGSFGLTAGRESTSGEADETYPDFSSAVHRVLFLLGNRAKTTSPLAEQLRSIRLKVGVTQEELAKRLGVEQSKISKLENGVETMSIHKLQEFMTALGAQLTARVTFPHTGEVEELALGNVILNVQQENHTMQSKRDYTKFDVKINGVTEECLPKRKAIFRVIKHLVASGVTPEDISACLPWRGRLFQSVEGKVGAAEFVALIARKGNNFDSTRFFSRGMPTCSSSMEGRTPSVISGEIALKRRSKGC